MQHKRVDAMPSAPEANTTYYIPTGTGKCAVYVVGATGTVRRVADEIDASYDPGDLTLTLNNGLI